MIIAALELCFGLILLTWGADRFVAGAAAAANNLGVPPLLIGLTIVGIGTSAPEMVISLTAALKNNPSLAIGNALGSNIANIGLVLGVASLIAPLEVRSNTLRREYPILFLISLFAWILMLDGNLNQFDGTLLLVGLILLMVWLIWNGLHPQLSDPLYKEIKQELPKKMSTRSALLWLIVGLITLPIASEFLVEGATFIARSLGISDLIIGLTIVAIGTSLPELATSIAGAIKNEHDIAVGNVLGSNMFNLLAVLPLPGLISPSDVDPMILSRDLPIMLGSTILLFVVAYGFKGPGHVRRYEGALLISCYMGYLGILYYTA